MRNGKKWAAAASILLVTCALTSCTMPRMFNDLMGDERYIPDNSKQSFGTPRRPILNPLHNAPRTSDQDSSSRSYTAPMNQQVASNTPIDSGMKRRVPTDNVAMLNGKAAPQTAPVAMAMTAPVTSVDEALAQKSVAAVEAAPAPVAAPVVAAAVPAPATGEMGTPLVLMKPSSDRPAMVSDTTVTAEQPVAAQTNVQASEEVPAAMIAAPVEPAAAAPAEWSAPQAAAPAVAAAVAPSEEPVEGTIKLVPPSSPKPGEEEHSRAETSGQFAMTAPAQTTAQAEPVVQTKPAVDAVATTAPDAAPASYPSLASIPESPEATPAKQIASDIKSLETERKESQTANQQLMNDPNSTVMTSPTTGQLVSNAAEAAPAAAATTSPTSAIAPVTQTAAAPKSESTWLSNLLGPGDQKAEEAKQAEEERKAAETVAAALAETAPQQQDLTVPPVVAAATTTTTTAPAQQTTEMAAAPATMEQTLQQLTPAAGGEPTVTLTPPATPASETASVVAGANAAETAPAAPAADTVKLTPPVNVAEAVVVKADKELTDIVEQPVEETQPLPVKKVEYLPESRYANKRLAPVNEAY